MRTRKRFTVEPGREIYFDGRPCISIHREGVYTGKGDMSPYQADQLTRLIARLLSKSKIAKRIAAGDWSTAEALED